MLIHAETQERVVAESPSQAGSTSIQGSIMSDSLIATLWVDNTAGSLDVSVFTLTDNGKETLLFSFPTISSGSTSLLLKKSGVSMQRFRIQVDYSGACQYEIYVRAISGIGESTTTLLSPSTLTTSQMSVSTTPVVMLPSSLIDRAGLIFRNWTNAGILYMSEDPAKLPGQGWPVPPGESLAVDVQAGVTLYGLADAGTLDVRLIQAG